MISAASAAWVNQQPNREEAITALTLWRENRGGGRTGMQTVCNAIVNRTKRHHQTFYDVCTAAAQFTSISIGADPQFNLLPRSDDPAFMLASNLAAQAVAGTLPDLVSGATVYYNPDTIVSSRYIVIPSVGRVKFPESWNQNALTFIVKLSRHLFFVER